METRGLPPAVGSDIFFGFILDIFVHALNTLLNPVSGNKGQQSEGLGLPSDERVCLKKGKVTAKDNR